MFFHIKCTDHPTKFPNGEPTNITIRKKSGGKTIYQNIFQA